MMTNLLFSQASALGKRLAMVLTMLVIVGIGQAWGADVTIQPSSKCWTTTLGAQNGTINGITISTTTGSLYYNSNNNPTQFRINSGATFSVASSVGNITKIDFTFTGASYQGGLKTSYTNLNSTSWSATLTGNARIQKIVVTYAAGPVHTVTWTINPAAGGSLSSTSGTSTTVTPNVAYTYGSPAYTVTPAGKANVSQDGDNFTATPSANCTIQINMVAKPKYTVNWYVNGTKEHSQTDISGTTLTNIPNLENYECGDKVFVGWTTQSSYEHATDAPNDLITNTTGMTIPENGEDYYAVFAEESKEEGTPIVSYEYKLVESALVDWSGDYLIAYSSTIFADGRIGGKDDGGIGDLNVYCNPDVDLSNDGKTVTSTFGDVYHVTLEKYDDKYLLKTQDGYYNYQTTNSNGLSKTATKNTAAAYALNIIFTSSSDIKLALSGNAQGAIFRYNGQGYFRFYKDGGQNPIYLYKKTQTTTSGGTTTSYSDYTTQCSKQTSRYLTPKYRGGSSGT